MALEKLEQDLDSRIEELQRQTTLLESGTLATRERRLRDNKPILVDNTEDTIARNKQWIADLRALAKLQPKPKTSAAKARLLATTAAPPRSSMS